MKKTPWDILSDEVIEDFGLFRLRKSTRKNPRTAKPYTFLLMDGLEWVNLIALTKEKEVVLVEQYRHGADCFTLELPGGCVESGEDPGASAIRELQEEETGYTVSAVQLLGKPFANPALQKMRIHCYVAFDAELTAITALDEGEDISVRLLPIRNFLRAVQDGKVEHALIVAAAGLFAMKYPEFLP